MELTRTQAQGLGGTPLQQQVELCERPSDHIAQEVVFGSSSKRTVASYPESSERHVGAPSIPQATDGVTRGGSDPEAGLNHRKAEGACSRQIFHLDLERGPSEVLLTEAYRKAIAARG